MSRFAIPFRGSLAEEKAAAYEAQREQARELTLRGSRLGGLLVSEAWREDVEAYMVAYSTAATQALVERSLSDEDRGVLRGKVLAFRDLRSWIDGILAAADEARRAASDEQNEAEELADNPSDRRF